VAKAGGWNKDSLEQHIKDFKEANSDQSGLRQATVRSLPAYYGAWLLASAKKASLPLHGDSVLSARMTIASEYLLEDMLQEEDNIDRVREIDEFLRTPLDSLERRDEQYVVAPELHLEVNMFAPDSMIIDDFKKWLKAARKQFDMPARNMFTPANMESWADNRVLPYIDLMIWAKFEGVGIGQETMGETIFPDAVIIDPDNPKDPASRIRKTVSVMAEYLMRPSVVDAINAQRLSQGYISD